MSILQEPTGIFPSKNTLVNVYDVYSSEIGNVHKVRSSDTLQICRSKMDPTFCSGRYDLPVGRQIIIKYGSVFYLSSMVHNLQRNIRDPAS